MILVQTFLPLPLGRDDAAVDRFPRAPLGQYHMFGVHRSFEG